MIIYDFLKLENNYNKSYEKIISQKKVTYLKFMVDGGIEDKTTVAPLFLLYFLPHGRPVIPSSLEIHKKIKSY